MTRIRGCLDIARPIDEVFDTIADQRNEPRYNPSMVDSILLTDEPIGVGSRFEATVRTRGGITPVTIEYAAFERPHRLASRSAMTGAVAEGQVCCERSLAGTRLSWDWTVTVTGPLRLAAPLIALIGRRRERAVWLGLKALLEDHQRPLTRHRRRLPEGFFNPVEYAARTRYRRPPGFYRWLQSIAPLFRRLGVTPGYVVELEVAGRRTGIPRTTLLVQVQVRSERYLVSLAGDSEWVRNVRAADGAVRLTDTHRRYAAHLVEVPVTERAEIIHAYIHRPSPRGRAMVRTGEARHYFGIDPDTPLPQIAAIADHYPVFRIGPRHTVKRVDEAT